MQTQSPPIGIDLGTTNSVVATVAGGRVTVIKNEWGDAVVPSVVLAPSGCDVTVGLEAKRQIPLYPRDVAQFFKRAMGTDEVFDIGGVSWSPVQLSAAVLGALRRTAESQLGRSVRDAVVTVPAYFRDAARRQTRAAAEEAGFNVLGIINEPVAAALAFGHKPGPCLRGYLFVFDLGGGTFDVTVVNPEGGILAVLGHDGNHLLGGKDWDDAILRELADRHRDLHGIDPLDDPYVKNELYVRAEELKRTLSTQTRASFTYTFEGVAERFELTRERFEALTQHLVHATIEKCREVLAATKVPIDRIATVLLVGGSSRMPMMRSAVEQFFGQRPNTSLNPDECVAMGAALHAAALQAASSSTAKQLPAGPPTNSIGPSSFRDATAHSLGLVVVAADGSHYENAIMLRRNTPIPTSQTQTKLVHAPQGSTGTVDVWLTQGESLCPYENEALSKRVFSGVPYQAGGTQVAITYSYNVDGVVDVSASLTTGAALRLDVIDQKPADLSWTRNPPPRTATSLHIGVTNKAYDDVGAVLRDMGVEHEAFESFEKNYDLVFVNCLSRYPAADRLKSFVENGGILYASDYAERIVCEAFPDAFSVDSADSGTAIVRVDNADLRAAVGDQLEVHLDTAWKRIVSVAKDVEVLLSVSSSNVAQPGTPIMLSFVRGRGQVFFTSFHNSAQAGRQQQNLLRCLVIKQLSAASGVPFEQLATTRGFLLTN